MCGLHCFRQCTRTIHSAHSRITLTELSQECGRTPSVRRQSAAKSGHSPESPPSATCCLSGTGAHHRWCVHCNSPNGVGNSHCLKAPQPFRFRLTGSSHPERTGRDCLAANESIVLERRDSFSDLRPNHRTCFRMNSTQATLPHCGTHCLSKQTDAW